MTMPNEEVFEPQYPVVPPPAPKPESDEFSDLFTYKREDVSDLVEVDDEDVMGDPSSDEDNYGDMSDLTEVTKEDIMGTRRKPKPRYRIMPGRFNRPSPPPTMGGMR